MCVVVIRDRSHVVVDVRFTIEDTADNVQESSMEHVFDGIRRCRVMVLPHHHRDETRFTFGDPTMIVFVETLGERSRLAQFTR
jgi:hypothetical protein